MSEQKNILKDNMNQCKQRITTKKVVFDKE